MTITSLDSSLTSLHLVIFCLLIVMTGCEKNVKDQDKVAEVVRSPVTCAPVINDRAWYDSENIAPLFDGMGDLNFTISTDNELVQRYFNQGLVLAYGFNHAEAARSFYYASKLDPDCAMTLWGYAYVLGPNYNAGMERDNYERAYDAIQKAIALSQSKGTEKERDMILALSKRYVKEKIEDRTALDIAYSDEMKKLFEKYPTDPDIGTLYAESIMNLHPWDLYESSGQMKPWTPDILSTLEKLIRDNPRHCGANHFYIHAVESSKTPERANEAAKLLLDGLVPNAGHLVHMPSHIYIRTGEYHQGTIANIRAIQVDSTYVTACHAQGVYPLSYFPHNQHFMAATATLEGNSAWALYAADAVSDNANRQLMKEPMWGTLQHYYTIPFYVYVKFGKWDEILSRDINLEELDYPRAILHYARGMAYLGKAKLDSARVELDKLSDLASKESLHQITIWDINTVYDLVQIAERVLHAEIAGAEGNFQEAIELLKEGVAIEDSLNYNEPPDWFFSVRHNLGSMQIAAGNYEDAIVTYQEDLERLPKNGWALKGLAEAYSKLGDYKSSEETEQRFLSAWKTADISLSGSVIQ